MEDAPDYKKPIENGLTNESEDSGNTSEQEPCIPTDLKTNHEMGMTDTIDSKHLDTEMMKQNKKRHNVNKKTKSSMWTTIQNSFTQMIKYLKEKTGLSTVGLVIAVIVILLLILSCVALIVLGIVWPTIPHEMRFPVCRRSACLRSSSEILPKMNTNVSACEDFEKFACGRWLQKHPHPPVDRSEWSLKRQLEYKTRDKLRQLILTQPHPTKVSSFAWKTKFFYESCMALDAIETVQAVPLTNQINSLGGWNVLREFQVHSFDLIDTFTRLHSTFGVSLFIKVNVVPDPLSAQDYIIQILPADLGLPDKSYYYRHHNSLPVETYKRFLKDVAQLLGATSSDAASFSEDMFFFEKRLAEIMPDTRDLHPLQAASKISVGNLKNIAPSVHLHNVLLSKYPEGNIEDNTQILVPYPDYLRNISSIISTTDRTALNNYMMWKLTERFLPYLSKKVRDTLAVYRRDLYGEQEPLQRWEFCIETLQQFMGFGLAVFLQNHADSFENDVKAVEDVFSDLMRQTKRSVGNAGWIPPGLQEHINGKLMSMQLEVGFPTGGTLLSDSSLEDMYRQFFVINRDFFQNVKNGISFLQHQEEIRLKKFDEIYRWMDEASNFDLKVHYIAAANKVVVPQALLQEPFFHTEYPLAVLFGNLGVEIASAIVKSISLWDILYADDGTLIDSQHPAISQSEQVSLHPVYCLKMWWGKEGFASRLVSNQSTFNALISISGVNIAFKALQEQLKYLPHIHQPALENFEDGHLFFITFAQSICSVQSIQQKDVDETLDVTLAGRALISVVVSQLKEFARLFSCTSADILYTEIPCEDVL